LTKIHAARGELADGQRRPHGPRRLLLAAAILLLAGLSVTTVRWFVRPPQGMPAHVDAIVMLDGPGDRLRTTLTLAWAHRAPVVVISRGSTYWGHGSVCAPRIPRVTVICFHPDPVTTRGEAEFAGRLAQRYHWRSIALVTITPQDTRARLRVERCFPGRIYVVTAPLPAYKWPYQIAYEWGATIKAFFLQQSC
jgi:uncharacterized SAM-binding protein YcdF (DUF218 family)